MVVLELGLYRDDEGNMRPLGWALVQCDWGPYKKRRSGHRHTWRDDPVRTQEGDGRLHAEERGLRRTSPAHTWIWDSSLRTGDSECLRFESPRLWCRSQRPWRTHALPPRLSGPLGSCCSFAKPTLGALALGPGFPHHCGARALLMAGGQTWPGSETPRAPGSRQGAQSWHPPRLLPPLAVWPWAGAALGVLTGGAPPQAPPCL